MDAPEEEIVRVGRPAAVLEQAQQVVELAMHVTHKLQWRFKFEKRGLLGEDGYGGFDEKGDFVAGQIHVSSRFLCAHTQRTHHSRRESESGTIRSQATYCRPRRGASR